jgi:signal transduction histidine kinase
MRTFKTKLFFLIGLVLVTLWSASLLFSLHVQRQLREEISSQYHHNVKKHLAANLTMALFHGPIQMYDSLGAFAIQGTSVRDVLFVAPDGAILNGLDPITHRAALAPELLAELDSQRTREYVLSAPNGERHIWRLASRMEAPASCGSCHDKPRLRYLVTDVEIPDQHANPFFLHLVGFLVMVAVTVLLLLGVREVHTRKVQSRLEEIRAAVEKVEEGDYRGTIPEPRDAELLDLIRSLNRMLRTLDSARSRLEEKHAGQLVRADRLASVGELAAGVAHEIKNPVSGILGAVNVILGEAAENDPLRPIYLEIRNQVLRVDGAINDLLSFARPRQPELVKIRVADMVENVLPLIRKQALASNVVISVVGGSDLPEIVADPLQLGQVLVNLLLNGIQAMPGGGTLTLRLASHPATEKVTLEVQDEGPGIPEGLRKEVFRPFFTTKHRGTGLGLAISRRIIEAHRGGLALVSRPGHGALFIITLPVRRGAAGG